MSDASACGSCGAPFGSPHLKLSCVARTPVKIDRGARREALSVLMSASRLIGDLRLADFDNDELAGRALGVRGAIDEFVEAAAGLWEGAVQEEDVQRVNRIQRESGS